MLPPAKSDKINTDVRRCRYLPPARMVTEYRALEGSLSKGRETRRDDGSN
jgi:hypothetical protein